MPNLSEHSASQFVKMLYIGASGSGKTGSLTSLMAAGYKLRIIDLDNGLDALRNHAQHEKLDLGLVDYEMVRDKYSSTKTGPMVKAPRAMVRAGDLIHKWSDETIPAEWGPEYVLVVDSLTAFGIASFEWAKGLNRSARDPRQWYAAAQQAVEGFIATITDEEFRCNVIVMTHIDFVEDAGGGIEGFASSIGKALGPKLPRYFNTMVAAESKTIGSNTKRTINTQPNSMLKTIKTPAPMRLEKTYPLETGLATLFKQLKGT